MSAGGPVGVGQVIADPEGVEFDTVFDVQPGGTVVENRGLYAPTVWHDEHTDVYIDGSGWEPLTGYTGQWSYAGACMHPSETFSGGLLRDVLDTPGTYALVVVQVLSTEDDEDPEPAGWAVLRRT